MSKAGMLESGMLGILRHKHVMRHGMKLWQDHGASLTAARRPNKMTRER